MAENESIEGKDMALEEKMEEFEAKILEVNENLKKGEITTIYVGDEYLRVTNYGDQSTVELKGITFGIIDKDGSFTYNKEGIIEIKEVLAEEDKTLEDLGVPDLEKGVKQREEELHEIEEEQKEDPEKDSKKPELEEEKEEEGKEEEDKKEEKTEEKNNSYIKDDKNWQEIEMDREFTDTDTLRKWTKDVLHESPKRIYRHQTGPHDFEYVGDYGDGEYRPLDLSTDLEGKNTRQEVYLLNEDGTLEKDEIDSLLLTKDGNYGIATKVPDTGTTDTTKSFSVTRTKDGKYIATQLIEKNGQNRDPKLPGKEIGDRTKSVYDKENVLDDKEEIEDNNLEIAEDGVTVDEISLYKYFEKKGYRPDTIDKLIKDIEDNQISPEEAEGKYEESQRTPWGDAEGRRSRR